MADPDDYILDFDDPIINVDELLMPRRSHRIDQRSGKNVANQHNVGENIMLNEDINQFGHGTSEAGPSRVNNQSQFGHGTSEAGPSRVNNQSQFEHGTSEAGPSRVNNQSQFGHGTSEAGPSRVNNQSNKHIRRKCYPETSGCGNPVQIPEWPVPAKPYACSCCQVLREITHTIEGESKKFEIHGRPGMIFHGILEICRGDMTAPNKEYRMFDFCKESIHKVKMFLEQYCKNQKEAGYTMVKDPLSTFYQAVSVGLDWDWDWDLSFDKNDFLQGSQTHIGDMGQPNVTEPRAQSNEVRSNKRKNKRTHQEQRDKIKTLTIYDIAQYFHLPQNAAAKEVGVSSGICKDICRDAGLNRWPFRQIRSLRKKIDQRRKSLITANPAERALAEADVQKFKQEIAKLYPPFT